MCFNTQPPEGGWEGAGEKEDNTECFNTQPPEGGWCRDDCFDVGFKCFNTQPPEGGWIFFAHQARADARVSTHSRPKAAG